MKKVYYTLVIPVLYSALMLYKTPTIADSLIVVALSALIGFLGYLSVRYTPVVTNTEKAKLEEELGLERLRLSIDQMKETAVRDKALRDSRASTGGGIGKEIRF